MITSYILNVGLTASSDSAFPNGIPAASAAQVLRNNGFTVHTTSVRRSATEPTLVALVSIDDGDMADALHEASVQLAQDCIAVYCPGTEKGLLVGPKAAAWGEFNPEFFLVFSGKLSAVQYTRSEHFYQGHLPGSGVQAHSAGGLFPWVIVAKQVGDSIKYGFLAPDGSESGCIFSYDVACHNALRHKEGQPARDAAKARAEAFRKGTEAAKAAARVEAPQVMPSPKVSLYDIPVELPHGIGALLVAANATGKAISSVYATSHEEALKLVRENGFTPLQESLPDADIGEEPVVEDGARCLLCDHPIPDVPEHKNSIGWFERRDFPETLSNDAWLALYNLLRGN